MSRQSLAVLLVLGVSCGGPSEPPAVPFPQVLQGDWQISTEEMIAPASVPELVRSLGLRQAQRAVYEGPESLTVVVYEMDAEAAAFELQQKWRAEEGRLTFYTGPRFVMLESPSLDFPTLAALGQALDQHWKQ